MIEQQLGVVGPPDLGLTEGLQGLLRLLQFVQRNTQIPVGLVVPRVLSQSLPTQSEQQRPVIGLLGRLEPVIRRCI
ncbi:hypothetical protein [Hydrogenophaga atypica]|uniref:hypothetical protein n=1 Tax=Hydrogenophaga atypica TaxID=249409 RepID=UPI0036D27EFF